MKVVIVFVMALLLFYSGYLCGYRKPYIQNLQHRLEFFEGETKFQQQISAMSDYDICRKLGGVRSYCEKLKPRKPANHIKTKHADTKNKKTGHASKT